MDVAASRAAFGEQLWAIRPEVYSQLLAAVEAGTVGELAGPVAAASARTSGSGRGGKIAILPIQGIIRPRPSLLSLLFGGGGATTHAIRGMLRDAVGDTSVRAIVLHVDSPGGLVDDVPELADEIREARGIKPIVAAANTTAASAAYWLASQASELWVTPSGSVGSIGVFVRHEDWSRFDERIGVKTTLIAAGKYKTEGNPFEPLSDTAREAIQADVDTYYDMFTAAVAAGRDTSRARVEGGFGEGRMVLAQAAVAQGMADAVGTLEDAIGAAGQLATGGRPPRASASRGDTASISADLAARAARLEERAAHPNLSRRWHRIAPGEQQSSS